MGYISSSVPPPGHRAEQSDSARNLPDYQPRAQPGPADPGTGTRNGEKQKTHAAAMATWVLI